MENLSCLRSLFLSDPQDDLASIRSAKGDRVHGTCEWVLAQDQYTAWLVEDSPQLLWLSGGPGIGKTMISSFLVEELTNLFKRSPKMILAYFFCDDKYQDRRTATAILRGLLLQILRQRPILFKHIQSVFDMSRDNLFTNFHALWRVFVSIVQDPEAYEICCLIDALDECEHVSRQLFLNDFVRLFCDQQSERTFVKFIITSRRLHDIEALFRISPHTQNLHIDSSQVNCDLQKFINVKVDELSTMKGYKSGLKEKIRCALIDKAGGTFLYVSLVVHDLKKTKLASQVTQKLRDMPADLNTVYDKILTSIDADCKELAVLVLRWVAVAQRPLIEDELAMVCALNSKEREGNKLPQGDFLDEFRDVYRCCEPLVYVDTGDDSINLVHQSAKDYLLGNHLQDNIELSQYHVVLDKTNFLILRTCWTYLSLDEFESDMVIKCDEDSTLHHNYLGPKYADYSFLMYADEKWLDHALASDTAVADDEEDFWKLDLKKLPELRDFWLIHAARRGNDMTVRRLLEWGADPNSHGANGMTALSYAAMQGDEAIVKMLLNREDVRADFENDDSQTPLFLAVEEGHETIVELLLGREDVGVNVNDMYDQTPLHTAIEDGREGIVKLLLGREDIIVDRRNEYRETPLQLAIWNGHEGIVKLLLGREDIIVDRRNGHGETPLHLAIRKGYEAIVKLLLGRGDIGINRGSKYGQTPLHLAAHNGCEGIVKLLLSREDVAINTRGEDGYTPLNLAAWNGHEGIVKLLLSRGDMAMNNGDKDGYLSSLDLAIANGHKGIVELLLSRGDVAIDTKDEGGLTLVDWAELNGRKATAKLLRRKMKDVSSPPRLKPFNEMED